MRIFLIVVLLNICSHSDAQNRKDKQVYNTVFATPKQVTITGENILIYTRHNTDSLYNYSITAYSDSVHFLIGDIPIELKPKIGVWYKPFCAYSLDEDVEVNGSFMRNFNTGEPNRQSEEIRTSVIKYNGISREYRIRTVPGKRSIPTSGCIFNCKKLPGILIFGDLADSKNQFVIIFNKTGN
jgi:hypothetical protein